MIKQGHQCKSKDEMLDYGALANVDFCAEYCAVKEDCKYFGFGHSHNKLCWWEKAESRYCPKGWKSGSYDFYEVTGLFSFIFHNFCD